LDPFGYDAGHYTPNHGTGAGVNSRHPYAGSFRAPSAFFDVGPVGSRVYHNSSSTSSVFLPSNVEFSSPSLTLVSFPSQKVMIHDTVARHFGPRAPFATHDEAHLPLLMVDGAASVRAARDANHGAHANRPDWPQAATMYHTPTIIDPPPLTTNFTVYGRFIWTPMLLKGRDFGGPEVWP
jgi:hypothetical protein